MKKKKEKNWNKNKNPEEQEQEQKIQNPQDYFLISLSLFLSLSEFLSFSHALSSLSQIGVAQIGVEALGRWDSDHGGSMFAHR